MARKYQHTMELLPQIKEMLAKGMTQKQVEDTLGLNGYRPVHELLKRERKTDISYIHTGEGVLYLSMIRDLYDSSIVAYKTATHQTVDLVLDTIRRAKRKEKVAAGSLQLHSDQGGQYASQL